MFTSNPACIFCRGYRRHSNVLLEWYQVRQRVVKQPIWSTNLRWVMVRHFSLLYFSPRKQTRISWFITLAIIACSIVCSFNKILQFYDNSRSPFVIFICRQISLFGLEQYANIMKPNAKLWFITWLPRICMHKTAQIVSLKY